MRPVITIRPLADFTPKRQADICKCPRRCKRVVLVVMDELVVNLCEKEASIYSWDILRTIEDMKPDYMVRETVWSPSITQHLVNYVGAYTNRVPNGAYTQFAELYGMKRKQVRDKVALLRRRGILPPGELVRPSVEKEKF